MASVGRERDCFEPRVRAVQESFQKRMRLERGEQRALRVIGHAPPERFRGKECADVRLALHDRAGQRGKARDVGALATVGCGPAL